MRRVLFALWFCGAVVVTAVVVTAVAVVVVAAMHVPDTAPDLPAEPPLPDGNSRGDALLDWAVENPDRARAPEYLEDL